MRCAYYCSGEAYDLHAAAQHFAKRGYYTKIYAPEVLHLQFPAHDKFSGEDFFVFSYGCATFWGVSATREEEALKALVPFLQDSFERNISDSCKYQIDNSEESGIDEENDIISLESTDPLIKLSLSYGLSQSVRLTVFENSADRTIEANKSIPKEMMRTGKISFSKRNVAQKIGELFAERNSINLHSTILDTPEFFWRRPKYESYYDMAVKFMDIKTRLHILNTRLDVIHELYEILSNELQHIHTSRLEMIIILLIFFEVLVIIFRDLLRWIE